MIPQKNNLSTKKSISSSKNFHSWKEIVIRYKTTYKLKGRAFDSELTKDQINEELDFLKEDVLPDLDHKMFRQLLSSQNRNSGRLNITTQGLSERIKWSFKKTERYLTIIYKKYGDFIEVEYYWNGYNKKRRQIRIHWTELLAFLKYKSLIKSSPLTGEGVTTLEKSCSYSSLNSSSSLNVFKKDILYSKNSETQNNRGNIKSELPLTLNISQSLSKTEEKEDNPPSVKSEELPSTKIKEDTPRMDKEIVPEESSTSEGSPPSQCGDNVTTLKKSFFTDGKKEMLSNRRRDPMGAFATHIQLHSMDPEEKEEKIEFGPITFSTVKLSDDFTRVNSVEELPDDIQEYLKTLPEEKRKSLIEESKLLPLHFRIQKDFPRKTTSYKKQEPVKIEDWKQKHYDKLEQIAKERERIEKEQKANRALPKEELRCYRINNIREIYKNWSEVLGRENCDLEEIQYRMRKNYLYEPFTKDTKNWNSECHPEYGFMNEDEKDFEFRRCVDIWMWPKPFKHSERNIKMFKKARVRADKLRITYYEWVAAIYDRIGELKIEYTHLNCSFAEELIEKWIEEGSNPPQNFGHKRRQNWLMYNQKGVKRKKYQPRKTMEQEIEEVREMLL